MRVRALLAAGAIGGAVVLGGAAPASAGGAWFDPVEDSYQPGDTVTLVGYTSGGSQGWVEDAPFHGFLVGGGQRTGEPGPEGFRMDVGELTIEQTGTGGYTFLRVSITFTLPSDLEPGAYTFDYCNAGCAEKLGDLVGATVHVGVPPPFPITRSWPYGEPHVADLDPSAELSGPSGWTTAGEVQDGRVEVQPLVLTPATAPPTSTTTTTPATASSSVSTTPAGGDELTADAVSVGLTPTDDGSSPAGWLVAGTAVVIAGAAGTTALVRRSQARRTP